MGLFDSKTNEVTVEPEQPLKITHVSAKPRRQERRLHAGSQPRKSWCSMRWGLSRTWVTLVGTVLLALGADGAGVTCLAQLRGTGSAAVAPVGRERVHPAPEACQGRGAEAREAQGVFGPDFRDLGPGEPLWGCSWRRGAEEGQDQGRDPAPYDGRSSATHLMRPDPPRHPACHLPGLHLGQGHGLLNLARGSETSA